MARDPFDELREANPLPDRSLPRAPMDVAEDILNRHRTGRAGRWPGWAVAAAAAAAALVIGGGWMLWLGRGPEPLATDPTVAAPAASTTSTAPASPIPPPSPETAVYLLDETATGPVLVPVPRVTRGGDEAAAALDGLLAGPTTAEETAGLDTALPEGIDGPPISLVSRDGSTVVVRIPTNWVDFGYPTPDGLAQIVFTLTRIEGIDGVGFLLGEGEGTPGGVVAGSMRLVPEDEFAVHPFVDDPATRLTFEGYMPLAFIESPPFSATVALPTNVRGVANSIGNQVRLTLEVDERTLWQETVVATCGTPWSECRGDWDWGIWEVTIPDLGYAGGGAMLTAEAFGSGVEIIDVRTYPLTIGGPEAPATTTTTVLPSDGTASPLGAAVYLLMEADPTHTTPGPHLVPASVPGGVTGGGVEGEGDAVHIALEALIGIGNLEGWAEQTPALSNAVPEGTRLLGFGVNDRIAVVDLSSEFVAAGGSLSMRTRLAQVVFTLTRFDYIDGVRIFIEGEPIIAVVDSGVVESLPPFARDEFDDLVPPILIETPVYWNWEPDATEPLAVRGTADVFEGTVSLALTDEDGLIIWEGFATAACGTGCRGDWSIEIPYSVPIDQRGALIAWEESAVDGSQLNVREHPIWLIATDIRIDECSGTDVPDDLPDQPGLPVEVAATRRAIFDAARSCDFDALSDLIGERFASFGHDPEDSIRVWMMEEAAEYRTMYWLAQTLRLPAAFDQPEEWPARWVWPSAAAFYPWDSVPEADRTALLEIYAEDDLQAFSEWGAFFMYRLGITPDGEWTFFAVGD